MGVCHVCAMAGFVCNDDRCAAELLDKLVGSQ